VRKVAREPRDRGGQRPERRTDGDDGEPVATFRQPRNRNTQQDVEARERQSVEQSHLRVGDTQLGLDGLHESLDDNAIHEAERGDQREKKHDPRGVKPASCEGRVPGGGHPP
jgi:hypothetical protein